ncbi:DoxX family protein [Pseudonocardia phyllosphaerae]|uniref:DoxX family protein n=1 Tax=Pseudonocardia phyllosphaerae TaxID=3390502 RepID=UPI00397C8D90
MRPLPSPLPDLALLLTRIVIGIVLLAHGIQKLGNGVGGVSSMFAELGIPAPTLAALFAMFVEVVGGAALLLGVLTPVAGILVFLNFVGAYLTAHFGVTVFVDDNGWELVGTIAVIGAVLAAVGPGKFSVDALLGGRHKRAVTTVS